MPFFGMLSVCLDVFQVIDDVDKAGSEGEQQNGCQSDQQRSWGIQLAVEDQGRKDKDVLWPLAGAHGFDDILDLF
jgi:hypothetical protein